MGVHNILVHISQSSPLASGQAPNMQFVHIGMECYSACQRKEIQSHSTALMNREDTALREISQTEKHKYCHNCAHWRSLEQLTSETEGRTEVAKAWETEVMKGVSGEGQFPEFWR